jgi:hypothetical protein
MRSRWQACGLLRREVSWAWRDLTDAAWSWWQVMKP